MVALCLNTEHTEHTEHWKHWTLKTQKTEYIGHWNTKLITNKMQNTDKTQKYWKQNSENTKHNIATEY